MLLIAASRRAHVGSTCFLVLLAARGSPAGCERIPDPSDPFSRRCPRTLLVSSGSGTRRALPKARRRSAARRHPSSGCSHAPLPGSRRRGSGTTYPSTATTRNTAVIRSRVRQPMHARTGPSPVGALVASVLSVLPRGILRRGFLTAGSDERADIGVYRLDDRVGNALPVGMFGTDPSGRQARLGFSSAALGSGPDRSGPVS